MIQQVSNPAATLRMLAEEQMAPYRMTRQECADALLQVAEDVEKLLDVNRRMLGCEPDCPAELKLWLELREIMGQIDG